MGNYSRKDYMQFLFLVCLLFVPLLISGCVAPGQSPPGPLSISPSPAPFSYQVHVIDAATQKPIQGAVVVLYLSSGALSNKTDTFGNAPFRVPETELNNQRGLEIEVGVYSPFSQNVTLSPEQSPQTIAWTVPPTPQTTETPTASPSPTPSPDIQTPVKSTQDPVTIPPRPVTPPLPGGVYVERIRIDPPIPRSKQNFRFYVTFLNTSGNNFDASWNVAIYLSNVKKNLGKPSGLSHIVLGESEVPTVLSAQIVPSGCQDFYGVVVIRVNQYNQPIDAPFQAAPGRVNRFDFKVCH